MNSTLRDISTVFLILDGVWTLYMMVDIIGKRGEGINIRNFVILAVLMIGCVGFALADYVSCLRGCGAG
jgi:hypothetical protein